MSLSADEFKEQIPATVLSIASELPVLGAFFKTIQILYGIEEGVLLRRWQVGVEQKLRDLVSDVEKLQSLTGVFRNSDDLLSDDQLHLIWQVQNVILETPSREKRKAAARILFYGTLSESDLTFDLASQMARDLNEMQEFHLLIIKVFGLQTDREITTNGVPAALVDCMSKAIFFKGLTDLVKLGFVVLSDGTWAGSYKTEYLDMFQKFILQDIQS